MKTVLIFILCTAASPAVMLLFAWYFDFDFDIMILPQSLKCLSKNHIPGKALILHMQNYTP